MDSGTLARFEIKYVVDSKPHPKLGTPCWLWTAAITSLGYGNIRVGGGHAPAHRLMWEHINGPVPEGLEMDHLCRVRHCVNPEHLEAVTHVENMRRAENHNTLKTCCLRGHSFAEHGSVKHTKAGDKRVCRKCHADKERARKRALRERA